METENESSMEQQELTLGQRLAAARKAKGWSIEQVADKLHYHSRWIENLEKDCYQEFTAVAYIKGYLRAYAKVVELSSEEFSAYLSKLDLKDETKKRGPELILSRQVSTSDKPIKWISFGIGGILVMLVVLWWNSIHNIPEKPATTNIIQTQATTTNGTNVEVF